MAPFRRFAPARPPLGVLACALAALGATGLAAAAGAIYTCKDAAGRTLTSDRPILECAQRSMRELAPDGSVRREIAPPMSREEREAHEREAERKRIAEESQRQQEALDRATLLSYPTMGALEAARRRAIEVVEAQILMSQRRMIDLHGMLERAQRSSGVDGRPNERLVRNLAQSILAEAADNARRRHEIREIEARFDEDAQRVRRALASTRTDAPVAAAR